MERTYITLIQLDEYMASDFVMPGRRLILKKEPDHLDDEAIAVYSPHDTKFGIVANSSDTVAHGTHSAGYIYRDFQNETACMVRFRLGDMAIAELMEEETVHEEIT
ncbi:MAG: hypothetical protein IJ225_09915 [Solobacterium sp.]|nr:hypothetical protein [Solobacterium sp.]